MTPSQPRVLLTIAGHDPSTGAGVTADLQTFAAHGFYGTSVLTALTVQSTAGVSGVEPVSPAFLRRTLEQVCADLPPAGIKIGMLGAAETAGAIADFLSGYLLGLTPKARVPIVLDPVLSSSSGRAFLDPRGVSVLQERLIPMVSWLTPNWPELAELTGLAVATEDQAEQAGDSLGYRFPQLHLVMTGGDQPVPNDILRLPGGKSETFQGEHISTASTHGTGCAFSSALLCRLVLGDEPGEAVRAAKAFVSEALRQAPGLGQGRGPLGLLWPLRTR